MKFETVRLGEIVIFNPYETIKKGTLAKKIEMSMLQPFTRDVSTYELAEYNGGTKFRNGDTIMARITPCLENGKTAKINILEDNEVGFGSTEYIVIRAIQGITDKDFVYYLACSSIVREPAIKSMVGSSGRQRVQLDVLQHLEISIPNIETQYRIASLLRPLDDKIALNNAINKNLEQQAQAIFKYWFVDFEPFGGVMPADWRKAMLGDITSVSNGNRPLMKQSKKTEDFSIPIIGATSIIGYTNKSNYNKKIIITGRVGTHGVIQRFCTPCWASDNTLVLESNYYEYVYQILHTINYKNLNRGSTQPLITQSDLKKIEIILPRSEILIKYEDIVGHLMNRVEYNKMENQRLASIRDTLLPKLMKEEIDVSKVKI